MRNTHTHTHTHRMSNVPEESGLREQIKHAIKRMKQEEATKHTENIVTGKGEEAEEAAHTNTPETTFLLVMQTKHQRELLNKYGNMITMMDGVYRTTKYGFPCFFVTVKTSLGIGRVVATVIPQYESEELLYRGTTSVEEVEPKLVPSVLNDRQEQHGVECYWHCPPLMYSPTL